MEHLFLKKEKYYLNIYIQILSLVLQLVIIDTSLQGKKKISLSY